MKKSLAELFAPRASVDIILDTDTYNEIDDQFAIAYLLKNRERIAIKGFTVAPFAPIHNKRVDSVAEGVEASKKEIETVLTLGGANDLLPLVKCGATAFMQNEQTPVESEAAEFIIRTSMGYTAENPLFVVAIGAITNVASALLMDADLKNRIAVIWLGGSAYGWWRNREFNMYQDIAAARVVMGSEVPFAQLPCQGVVSEFITTKHEMEHWLTGKNPMCDYLLSHSMEMMPHFVHSEAWGKCLWDVTAIGFLLNDSSRFMRTQTVKVRLPQYGADAYEEASTEKEVFYVCEIRRDALMYDLYTRLGQ